MHTDKNTIKLYTWKVINALLITLAFYCSWYFKYNTFIRSRLYWKGNLVICLVFLCFYTMFSHIYEAFDIENQRRSVTAFSQALSAAFADSVMYVLIFILRGAFVMVYPLLLSFLAQCVIISLWIFFVDKWYYSHIPAKKAIIVSSSEKETNKLLKEFENDKNYKVLGSKSLLACMEEENSLAGIDAVFISCPRSESRDSFIKSCNKKGVRIFFIPTVDDMLVNAATPVHMFHKPVMTVRLNKSAPDYRAVKRLIDIIASLAGIAVLWPFMLITAILVKAGDGGPCIYKQKRLTKNGKVFELYKFRSMRVDAEADGVARLSTGDKDNRITPFGKIMRKCRLDELPQLFNILKGDMTIVGPRPERPEISAKYEETLPEFRLRLEVKAGLTGYAQVYGAYNTTPGDKLKLDLMYISKASLLEDIKIIFATVKILFLKESTEGIAEGSVTAGDIQ